MSLTQFGIVNSAPKDKPYKLSDGAGLHLLIKPAGSKLWRLRYRFGGRENMLALGSFPTVGLGEAQKRRDDAQKLLAAGRDPSQEKKLGRLKATTDAQNTFGVIAGEYLANLKANRVAETTLSRRRG